MKNKLRKFVKILFILCIFGLFTGLTVVLIIIAQGGKVTPQGISQTGIVRLHVEPSKDIKVYVDEKSTNLNDQRIENLEPGEYQIKVEKEGYTSWSKLVSIEEGIVKELYVTLFPEELELEQITTTQIDRAFFSPDGNFVVYVVKDGTESENGIWKLKLAQNTFGLISNKPERLYNLDETLKSILSQTYDIKIAYDNSKLLLTDPTHQIVMDMDGNKPLIILSEIQNIGFMSDKLMWFENGDSLVIEKDNAIYEFDIAENLVKFVYKFAEDPIYAVNGRSLIFYTNNNYYSYLNNQKTILKTDIKAELPVPESMWLSPTDEKLLYIKSASDIYFINLEKSIHKIGEFEILELAPKGQGVVLKNKDNQIFVFRSELIAARNQIDTIITQIAETFDPQTQSYKWSSDSSHIIYLNSGETSLIDVYGANTNEILKSDQIRKRDYQLINESSEFIILLSDSKQENSSNLYKIDLRK